MAKVVIKEKLTQKDFEEKDYIKDKQRDIIKDKWEDVRDVALRNVQSDWPILAERAKNIPLEIKGHQHKLIGCDQSACCHPTQERSMASIFPCDQNLTKKAKF
jgi:hypothetical protein